MSWELYSVCLLFLSVLTEIPTVCQSCKLSIPLLIQLWLCRCKPSISHITLYFYSSQKVYTANFLFYIIYHSSTVYVQNKSITHLSSQKSYLKFFFLTPFAKCSFMFLFVSFASGRVVVALIHIINLAANKELICMFALNVTETSAAQRFLEESVTEFTYEFIHTRMCSVSAIVIARTESSRPAGLQLLQVQSDVYFTPLLHAPCSTLLHATVTATLPPRCITAHSHFARFKIHHYVMETCVLSWVWVSIWYG